MKTHLLLIAFLISTYCFSQIPNDAVRSYSFANAGLINSGSMMGGDLTTTGTSFTSVTDFDGNANSALDMNGDTFDGGVTPITSQESSYSFWINVATSSTGTGRVLNHLENGSGSVEIYIQNTNLVGRIEDSAGFDRTFTIPNINDGLWHHIALTIEQVTVNNNNGYEGRFYKNGILIGTDITNGTNSLVNPNWITFFTNPVFSLNDTLANSVFYQDSIDEVQVFDRVLTAAEVTALATNNSNPPLTQIFVDADAAGANDGTSWTNAYTSLQTALQLNPGGEFWVADGTYLPGTQQTSTFDLSTANTVIYGGFDGTETMLSERDPLTNVTILSGDLNSNDTTVSYQGSDRLDNSYHVVTINAADCVIDGVTITSGHAIGSNAALQEGAAISVNNGNFTLTNSKVEKCVTSRGGAIRAIDQQGTMTINRTIFSENLGNIGPVLYARAGNANFIVDMTNCLLVNNAKESIGTANGIGLIWIRQDGGGVIGFNAINNTVVNNTVDNSNTNTPVFTISQLNGSNRAANAYVYNTIFHNNRNITNGGSAMMIALGNGTSQNNAQIYAVQYSISEMGFPNIPNNGSTGINTNNSTANPMFTSATDFTLQTGSPAIDSGNNSLANGLSTDLAGNARVINNVVDRGAYEFGNTGSNPNDFIWTWRTTTANETITMPTLSGSSYNYTIDWGDGSTDSTTYTSAASHTYVMPGDYDITITGIYTGILANINGDADKLIDVKQWGSQQWETIRFQNAINLQITATDTPDLSQVQFLERCFEGATSFNSNINNWDTSAVISMSYMFKDAISFNQPLDNWDTGNVTTTIEMFRNASVFNQSLNNWDTSSLTDMRFMFGGATSFNQPLNNWNTSNVTKMSFIFLGANSFNQPLNLWDTTSVTEMASMFQNATAFNQNISGWNTGNVIDMQLMFANASSFNGPLNNLNTSNVTNMTKMFEAATSFDQSINGWNVSNVTNIRSMFRNASSFNRPLNNWNTSNVSDMSRMFENAQNFNQNLSAWNVTNLFTANNMLTNSGMDINNYSSLLQGWSGQVITNSVTLSVGPQYCQAAQGFRDVLTNVYGWTITDGGVDTSANCTLSNEDLELQSIISLYPNPASNEVTVELSNDIIKSITIYNLQGQSVKSSNTSKIFINDLNTGIYLVKVFTSNGNSATQKMIKK
ncbi:chitinase [Nonlabens tegetincola]|uniref:Chitinase n=1 Tax=Nonlabens tegetincola TaxID=323273 RepID=A0A090QL83_9FLAO|nr:BspA family leucine-rich repeat surface protein [Nonlabens tegetincola]GAK96286.1 chitinase [Nonlabens tegetincola]